MAEIITLLTEAQARSIAETAAIEAIELLLEKSTSKLKLETEVMTVKETAEYLRCSTSHVRNKIKSGGLPVYGRLGHPRLLRSDVIKWLIGE